MDEYCIKINFTLSIAILIDALIELILFSYMSIYTYKYMNRFGKERDKYVLATAIFILLYMILRIITNIEVAVLYLKNGNISKT